MIERPLDLLHKSKGKKVLVNCGDGLTFSGKLLAYDIHINVVLEDARRIEGKKGDTKLGLLFIRGDSVKFISPGE